jgi:multidrug resistance protein MdtO
MQASGYLGPGIGRFVRFLGDEIRVQPGRVNVMLRCVLGSAIVTTTSMALQVPFLAVSLITVFLVTQSNVVMTRLVGLVFIIGVTLAVGVAILVIKLTYDYPLLRILLSAAVFFFSIYMMRVAKTGAAAFFVVCLVVIYFQSFVDLTDNAEALVRLALWIWVAVTYAIAITLLINTLCLPVEPVQQLKGAMLGQLAAVDAALAHIERGARGAGGPDARQVQSGILTLQRLLQFSTMREAEYRRCAAYYLALVTTVSRLHTATAHLPDSTADIPAGVLSALRAGCERLGHAIRTDGRFTVPELLAHVSDNGLPGALQQMRKALFAFASRSAAPESTETKQEKGRLLVTDAFSNPVYTQFALKTLLATMAGYLFYLATDWQGIHTVMLTSLIVAQPSLGATSRRAVLRIGGAALGSVSALAMVIWVEPRIDGIVGLLMTSLPVIALGAWVGAGSERTSYAGTQLMFTFAIALLEQFGPVTELTGIRDRMVGILLGVAISAVVHASLWPEAEGEALRQRVARLLRNLAARLRQPGDADTPTALWAELADCEAMAARVALEPGWQMGEGQHEGFQHYVQTMLAQTREILLAADAFDVERCAQPTGDNRAHSAAKIWEETAGVSLERYASDLTEGPEAMRTPAPVFPDLLATDSGIDQETSGTDPVKRAYERLTVRARRLIAQVSTLPSWSAHQVDTEIIE